MSTTASQEASVAGQEQSVPAAHATSRVAVVDQSAMEEQLRSISYTHPAVVELNKRPSTTEGRTILKVQPEYVADNLTCSTLIGSDMIGSGPYVFTDDEAGSVLAFYHLGKKLSGHAGIVHGGIPAVLLDEAMGRACFPRLAGKIGVTAKLDLEYKSPIPVGSIVLIRADTREIEGRKAWVDAVVEDAVSGQVHVKATALYVEPKWAASMSKVL